MKPDALTTEVEELEDGKTGEASRDLATPVTTKALVATSLDRSPDSFTISAEGILSAERRYRAVRDDFAETVLLLDGYFDTAGKNYGVCESRFFAESGSVARNRPEAVIQRIKWDCVLVKADRDRLCTKREGLKSCRETWALIRETDQNISALKNALKGASDSDIDAMCAQMEKYRQLLDSSADRIGQNFQILLNHCQTDDVEYAGFLLRFQADELTRSHQSRPLEREEREEERRGFSSEKRALEDALTEVRRTFHGPKFHSGTQKIDGKNLTWEDVSALKSAYAAYLRDANIAPTYRTDGGWTKSFLGSRHSTGTGAREAEGAQWR